MLIVFVSALHAKTVEFYQDWNEHAVGAGAFEKPASGRTFCYDLRCALEEKGFSIRFWDRKAHEPYLLTRKLVHGWKDALHWLGWGRPRVSAFEEETAYLIFENLGVPLRHCDLSRLPKEKMILFIMEPPTVQPELYTPRVQQWFKKIYTWDDDLVDNVRFFKCYPFYKRDRIAEILLYEERKFLTFIVGRLFSKHPKELYSERERLIRFFEARPEEEFDLWGRYWGKRNYRNWRGEIAGSMDGKLEVLKRYKFAIAYENTRDIKGYITEKLFDCFATGVVPIYWGASNVTEYVPEDCFIDRRKFQSDEEMLVFLKAMPRDVWEGYVKRGEEYLHTEVAGRFTVDNYLRTLAEAVTN